MRQTGVQLKRGFVDPLRVDRKLYRFPNRFKNVDSEATGFPPRGPIYLEYFLAKRTFHSRQRVKTDNEVKRHRVR